MGCHREMTMPRPPNRDPRAPQLALALGQPEVTANVFADEAVHECVRLDGIRFAEIEADRVELKRFVLTEVDLGGAMLDRLDLQDGSIKGCDLANLRSKGCTVHRVVIEASRLTGMTLVEPGLMDVVFRECPIDLASFRFGRLKRVRLRGVSCSRPIFKA